MLSVPFALLLSLLVSAGATPLVRRLALAVGAVDHPGARRVHSRHIPRLGGIAIVALAVPSAPAGFSGGDDLDQRLGNRFPIRHQLAATREAA